MKWFDVTLNSGSLICGAETLEDFRDQLANVGQDGFVQVDMLVTAAVVADMFPGQDAIAVYIRPDLIMMFTEHPDSDNAVVVAKEKIVQQRKAMQAMTGGQGSQPVPDKTITLGPSGGMSPSERERLLQAGGLLSADDLAKLVGGKAN